MNEAQTEMTLDRPVEPESVPGVETGLPEELLRLVAHLRCHCQGPDNARTATEIGRCLGFPAKDPARHVRALISIHYRQLPFVVCGSGGSGFYVAQDGESVTHESRSLHSRLICLAKRLDDLRHVAKKAGYTEEGIGENTLFSKRSNGDRSAVEGGSNALSEPSSGS